jgi:hypothetical protein
VSDVKCKTCGAIFESEDGLKPCPQPSPGRPYKETGIGNHIFDVPVNADALVDSMAKSMGIEDEEEPYDLSYEEARSNMASMLGNFGYGWHLKSLAGFMDEMVNFFGHENRVTEEQFVTTAREAWRKSRDEA